MRPIISVRNLGKRYYIERPRNHNPTLRDAVIETLTSPLTNLRNHQNDLVHLWALKEVSFDVNPGEVVGFIGRNGAGKSTLLKILARVVKPSTGEVDIYGRVGSLLGVGTGFHPDLSGRENIFLNGTILGMKSPEIRRKFDEIVDFAEVDQFLDTAVKHYSSGMYLRLAFSIAAHLEPEVMLLDEVLAVGDKPFQEKCFLKMKSVSQDGRTVFIVSHDLKRIEELCTRVFFVNAGKLHEETQAGSTIAKYVAGITTNEVTPEKHAAS
jgi:lipopolysaccharide transport system ATP-binding protein